ncbi:MAG: hypothetical protein H0U27_12605, partial [Nitrosopumilus sp.]|nr:hypothetical protein [Nitrosopumilus sp.]
SYYEDPFLLQPSAEEEKENIEENDNNDNTGNSFISSFMHREKSPKKVEKKKYNNSDDEALEKQEFLHDIFALRKEGIECTLEKNREPMSYSLEYLTLERENMMSRRHKQISKQRIIKNLKYLGVGAEYLNERTGKFLLLDGLADAFGEEVDNSPMLIDGIYKRYYKTTSEDSIEWQLAVLFIGTVISVHAGHMFGTMKTQEKDTPNDRVAPKPEPVVPPGVPPQANMYYGYPNQYNNYPPQYGYPMYNMMPQPYMAQGNHSGFPIVQQPTEVALTKTVQANQDDIRVIPQPTQPKKQRKTLKPMNI